MRSRWLGLFLVILSVSGQSSGLDADSESEPLVWECVLEEGPWEERGEPVVFTHDESLWLLGGMYASSVFRSADGKDWSCVQAAAPWLSRYGHCAFAFQDSLWVHGGEMGYALIGDVWRSDKKGIEWEHVFQFSKCLFEQIEQGATVSGEAAKESRPPETPWKARSRHSVAVHNGMLWMAGGLVAEEGRISEEGVEIHIPTLATHDVWCSKDGKQWEQVTEAANWAPRWGFGFCSMGGKLWVLGGAAGHPGTPSFSDDIWSSEDGRQWTLAGRLACGPRADFGICNAEQGVYVLGGHGSDAKFDDVWFSPDATTWKRVGTLPNDEPRWRPGACWFHDRLWLIGGTTGNGRQHFADVWVTK